MISSDSSRSRISGRRSQSCRCSCRGASALTASPPAYPVVRPPAAGAKMDAQDEKVAALDAQYKKMVDEQPGNAMFLHEVKGDPKRAEEYYSRAMLADPSDGEIMSQYAKLVWEAHHDRERSLSYFHKSVQAAPQNSHVLAAYASFLWEQEQDDKDFGEGEQCTSAAAPEHATGTEQVRELASATV